MARGDIGATFSDIWYRVAGTRPRLSPHASIIRQQYGPHITYIVEEPAGGSYYRLSPTAYFFVGLLDGTRTVQEAWDACNTQLADNAPTQRECVDLLSQLQLFGLLLGDLPLEADMVLERIGERRKRRRDQRTGRWLFPNIPIVNPEPFLERHRGLWRVLFSKGAFAAWLVLVGTAIALVLVNHRELRSSFEISAFLTPASIAMIGVLFLVLRAVHEIGHAAACKAFGGRVTEIGLILIAYVLPIPYCDATSAWRFPSLTHRVVVSLGGIYFETIIAATAAILWAFTDNDTAASLRVICYNAMLVSGVTTIFFNLNPLLRYDGYYVLSDMTGTPNLAQRSRDTWRHFIVSRVFGSPGGRPPATRSRAEAALLWVFGALSTPYRIFIMFAILLAIITKYPGLGIALGAVVGTMWIAWPLIKGAGFLLSSPTLMGRRARAIGITLATIVVGVAVIAVIRAPAASYAYGTVEPATTEPVRTRVGGFLESVHVGAGDHVDKGDIIVRLANPRIDTDLRIAQARADQARAQLELDREDPTRRRISEQALLAALAGLDRARDDHDALNVAATAAGTVVIDGRTSRALDNQLGRYIERGVLIASVARLDDLLIRVSMSEREHAYAFRRDKADETPDADLGTQNIRTIAVRVRGDAGTVVRASIANIVPKASRDMLAESLSTRAGGVLTPDPADPTQSLTAQFLVEVRPDEPVTWTPGLRARVRFGLPPEPLARQWMRRARQYLKGRLG